MLSRLYSKDKWRRTQTNGPDQKPGAFVSLLPNWGKLYLTQHCPISHVSPSYGLPTEKILYAYLAFRTDIPPENTWSDYLRLDHLKKPPRKSGSNPVVNRVVFGTSLHFCIQNLDFGIKRCAVFKIPITMFGEDIGLLYNDLSTGFYLSQLIPKLLSTYLANQLGIKSNDMDSTEVAEKLNFIEACLKIYHTKDTSDPEFSLGRYVFENRQWMSPLISTGNQQSPKSYRHMLIPHENQLKLIESSLPRVYLDGNQLLMYQNGVITDPEAKDGKEYAGDART